MPISVKIGRVPSQLSSSSPAPRPMATETPMRRPMSNTSPQLAAELGAGRFGPSSGPGSSVMARTPRHGLTARSRTDQQPDAGGRHGRPEEQPDQHEKGR